MEDNKCPLKYESDEILNFWEISLIKKKSFLQNISIKNNIMF